MKMRRELLSWYDQHKRILPWRKQGLDPYQTLLSEIMLQQTTVTAVKPYFQKFINKWPNLHTFAKARDEEVMAEWAGLGYYSRARNLLKACRALDQMPAFPQTAAELQNLPGIGEYTAAAIASIAFGEAILPIDGNVKRVLARFHAIQTPIDKPNPELKMAAQKWASPERPGDLAQAFMDLGSSICTPKSPKCSECPLAPQCLAHQNNLTSELPKKSPKRPKKYWHGHAYILETPSGIAFEQRPKGLLGEMPGLPSQMGETVKFDPPIQGNWQEIGEIKHIFTHIQLRLKLWYLKIDKSPASNKWQFLDQTEQDQTATLWKKALTLKKEKANGAIKSH